MKIDKKILEEINRYKFINKYITEQEAPEDLAPPAAVPPPPAPGAPEAGAAPAPTDPAAPGGTLPPPPAAPDASATPEPIDVSQDPDVEEVKDEGGEEMEITDLVNAQKNIETKQEEYFNNLFKQLETLETKLSEMDKLVNMVNSLEQKVEKFRPKTPEEKLELRSLDSGPFNQKLSDYFTDKESDFEKTGREEYILTKDEVEDFSPKEIKDTFDSYDDEEDMMP
jgi:hypothetical protein